jgi:uncharacterized protein YbjT (DUF2867 family)
MSDDRTILITGATGNTGSGVARVLLAQGRRAVRALVRDAGKAAALAQAGAEVVEVDLDRPETLEEALFDGVERVYFVTWNGSTALQQWRNFLSALRASGATPHVVRHSAFGTPESRIIADVEKADEELEASGLSWTVLAPTFFMQNVMMSAPTIKEQGAIYWDWGEGKAGMIDVRDVVDSAVGALVRDPVEVAGERFVLTGPSSIGFADVAATLSGVLGKEVSYVPVPHEAALDALKGMGVPDFIAHGYEELSRGFEAGFADMTTDGVERLTGHAPRSFATFAGDFRAAFE